MKKVKLKISQRKTKKDKLLSEAPFFMATPIPGDGSGVLGSGAGDPDEIPIPRGAPEEGEARLNSLTSLDLTPEQQQAIGLPEKYKEIGQKMMYSADSVIAQIQDQRKGGVTQGDAADCPMDAFSLLWQPLIMVGGATFMLVASQWASAGRPKLNNPIGYLMEWREWNKANKGIAPEGSEFRKQLDRGIVKGKEQVKDTVRKNGKFGNRGALGIESGAKSLWNGFVWLNVISGAWIGVRWAQDAITNKLAEFGVIDPVKETSEAALIADAAAEGWAITEYTMKATAFFLSGGGLASRGDIPPWKDPCGLIPIGIAAATIAGLRWGRVGAYANLAKGGAQGAAARAVQKRVIKDAGRNVDLLANKIEKARNNYIDEIIKEDAFKGIPENVLRDYDIIQRLKAAPGPTTYRTTPKGNVKPTTKVKDNDVKRKLTSSSGKRTISAKDDVWDVVRQAYADKNIEFTPEIQELFTKAALQYNQGLAEATAQIAENYIKQTARTKGQKAFDAFATGAKGAGDYLLKIMSGMGSRARQKLLPSANKTGPGKIKGTAEEVVDSTPSSVPDKTPTGWTDETAIRVRKVSKEMMSNNFNTAQQFAKFSDDITDFTGDPVDLLRLGEANQAALTDILEEGIKDVSARGDIKDIFKIINSNKKIVNEISEKITKELNIDQKIFNEGAAKMGKTADDLSNDEIAELLSEHLLKRFWNETLDEAGKKTLTDLADSLHKNYLEKQWAPGPWTKGLAAVTAITTVMAVMNTTKKEINGDFYYTGEGNIGRGTAWLLNTIRGKEVLKAYSESNQLGSYVKNKRATKQTIERQLKGAIMLPEGITIEDWLEDPNWNRTGRDGKIIFDPTWNFFNRLRNRNFESAKDAVDLLIELRLDQLRQQVKTERIQKEYPGLNLDESELLLAHVNALVYGSGLEQDIARYLETERGTDSQENRKLNEIFKVKRRNVTSAFRRMRGMTVTIEDVDLNKKRRRRRPTSDERGSKVIQRGVEKGAPKTTFEPPKQESKTKNTSWGLGGLRNLVREFLKENSSYNIYPYHSQVGESDEPAADFMEDWKDFELSLIRDETRNTAIAVAKILVKDLELFGDVIDLVGQNQSVATEILKKMRKNEEKK